MVVRLVVDSNLSQLIGMLWGSGIKYQNCEPENKIHYLAITIFSTARPL